MNGDYREGNASWLDMLTGRLRNLIKKAKAGLIIGEPKSYKPYNETSQSEMIINFKDNNFSKYSTTEKIELLKSYFPALKRPQLKKVTAAYTDLYKEKAFKSSLGFNYYYDINQGGLRFSYTLLDGEKRFDDDVQYSGNRFDILKGHLNSLVDEIEKSFSFINANTIESGIYPVVMNPEVAGVFAHESFGHKSEADFMLGDEKAKQAWEIGSKVGSEKLSIVDHGSGIDTSEYCPFDDEGLPATKTYLIKNGILQGRLHSIETANAFDERPTGNARSINFEFEPIVRMTNTYIEPGDKTFEELISKVSKGVYATGVAHGSGLSTFTIAPKKCYMIRDGKIAEPVKVSVISGDVFKTLGLIVDCSKEFKLEFSVFGGCGKMEQWPLPVGLGGAYVLVSEMMVS